MRDSNPTLIVRMESDITDAQTHQRLNCGSENLQSQEVCHSIPVLHLQSCRFDCEAGVIIKWYSSHHCCWSSPNAQVPKSPERRPCKQQRRWEGAMRHRFISGDRMNTFVMPAFVCNSQIWCRAHTGMIWIDLVYMHTHQPIKHSHFRQYIVPIINSSGIFCQVREVQPARPAYTSNTSLSCLGLAATAVKSSLGCLD